jgi:hypothetical protein
MRTRPGWFAAWLCLVSAAAARDIYVNNLDGDDRSLGSRPRAAAGIGGPVATISKALRLAEAGDRIVVIDTGQPYRESLSLVGTKHSGSTIRPFIIEGNGAVLDGTSAVPNGAWKHHLGDVFYFEPLRLGYQQLFLNGHPAVRHPAAPSDVSLPALAPLEWCLKDGRIYFCVEAGRLPSDYELACCSLQTGITLYYVQDVVIRDLIVQGFHVDGVNSSDAVRSAKFEGLTCRGNGRSGITAAGSSRVEVDDCRLGNNGASQLRSEGYSQTQVFRSQLIGNTAPALVYEGGRVTIDGQQMTAVQP